jgi:hypothetical protein
VKTLCDLFQDVAGALTPTGEAVKFAEDVSEDFSMAVKQRSVQVYQAIEKSNDIHDVIKDGTDVLVLLAAKDGLKRAGYGQFAAGVDILKHVQENAEKAQHAAEFKSTVQEQIRTLDNLIKESRNNTTAQREKLEAVEALKDAVVAACNEGQPTQVLPEFASGADEYLPTQNVSSESTQNVSTERNASSTPWWANLGSVKIPSSAFSRRTAVLPTKQAAPVQPGLPCPGWKPGDTVCP